MQFYEHNIPLCKYIKFIEKNHVTLLKPHNENECAMRVFNSLSNLHILHAYVGYLFLIQPLCYS